MEGFFLESSVMLVETSFESLSVVPVREEKKRSGCKEAVSEALEVTAVCFVGFRPVITRGAAGFFCVCSTDLAGYARGASLSSPPFSCSHAVFSSEAGDRPRIRLVDRRRVRKSAAETSSNGHAVTIKSRWQCQNEKDWSSKSASITGHAPASPRSILLKYYCWCLHSRQFTEGGRAPFPGSLSIDDNYLPGTL